MIKAKDVAASMTPTEAPVSSTPDAKMLLAKFVKEESKTVRGRFRCFESPGSQQRIMVKKYKALPMFDQWMRDGEVYEVPFYVARHLNGVDVTAKAIDGRIGTCSYPVHGFKSQGNQLATPANPDSGGIPVPIVGISKRVRRYAFESLEFDSQVA